jgi:hypothetical protein
MDRRRFLTGLGGIAVGLPMLSVFRPRGVAQLGGARPTRFVTVTYPMGTYVPGWRPSATGSRFELGPITDPLAGLESRCLFVANCDNAVHELVDAHKFGHPGKEATTLTGTLTLDAIGGDGRNHVDNVRDGGGADEGAAGPSVDEVIGRHLRTASQPRPSINLAVNGRPDRGRGTVNSLFFYESAGNPVSLQADVGAAFNDLFGALGEPETVDPAIEALHARNRSVLDAVRDSFTDLRQGLGRADRRVLDEHAEKLRQLERDVMRVSCGAPGGVSGSSDGASMRDLAPLQNRIAAAALGCDMAPVARIEFIEQQNPRFGVPVVDDFVQGSGRDWHHWVHQVEDDRPARVQGFRFFVDMYADLLRELADAPDGPDGATLLDNTMVLLASNFGPGNGHSAKKMCFVMAGNLGTGRTGYFYDAATGDGFYRQSAYNVNHLMNSIVEMVGVTHEDGRPMTEFGLEGFASGNISELFG